MNSATILALTRVLIQAANIGVNVYVASQVSTGEYATFAIAILITILVQSVADCGVGEYAIQNTELCAKEYGFLSSLAIISSILLAAGFFFLRDIISEFYENPKVAEVIVYFCFAIVIKSFGIISYKVIEKDLRFDTRGYIDLFAKTVSVVTTIVLVYRGYAITGLAIGWTVFFVLQSIVAFIVQPIPIALRFPWAFIAKVYKFSLSIIFIRLLWFTSSSSTRIVGGKMLPAGLFGELALASQLLRNIYDLCNNIVATILLPHLSKAKHAKNTFQQTYFDAHKYILTIAGPIFIGLSSSADEIVELLLSSQWQNIGVLIKLIAIEFFFRMFNIVNETTFIAGGNPGLGVRFNLVLTAATLVAAAIGCLYGPIMVCILALVVAAVFSSALTLFTIHSYDFSFSTYFGKTREQFIGILVLVLATAGIDYLALKPMASLVSKVGVGAIAYFVILYLLDREFIMNLVTMRRADAEA